MSEWNWSTIGELTHNFDSLRRPVKSSDRLPGPIPYYGASGIIDWVEGHTHDGEFLLIAEDGENLRSRSTPIAFMSRGKAWVNNHAHVVAGNHRADTRFLGYLLAVTDVLGYLTGSAQPKLSRSSLDSIAVRVPNRTEQQAIAEVLGALDDKIAANVKLAKTAEQLAAAEFQRHVSHLPFSEKTFADVARVGGGGTPKTSVPEFWDGDVLWATPTDVTGLQGPYLSGTSRRISDYGLNACASELYPVGSILMTSRATIGAFALAQKPMAVNQGFIVVRPHDDELRLWIFHEMRSRVDEFISLANGATFLELSRGNFKKFKVRLAEPSVMKEFAALAEPVHTVAANALAETAKLAATRDILLPQLVSGTLRVKDAEKVLEGAGV